VLMRSPYARLVTSGRQRVGGAIKVIIYLCGNALGGKWRKGTVVSILEGEGGGGGKGRISPIAYQLCAGQVPAAISQGLQA